MIERLGARPRLLNLDVLRGLAILLILLMNIPYQALYASPDWVDPRLPSWTGLDRAAWWVVHWLDGTQRGLLELLFGAGVVIMTRAGRPAAEQAGVFALHLRRNLWLAAFGVFQGVVLLWPGDILLSYGIAALLVFPFRNLAPRWLAVIGIALIVAGQGSRVPDYLDGRAVAAAHAAGDPAAAPGRARLEAARVAPPGLLAAERDARTGDFATYAAFVRDSWVQVQFGPIALFWLNLYEAFATMLLGAALWKTGWLRGDASRRSYVAWLVAGYGIGTALRVVDGVETLQFSAAPTSGDATEDLSRLLLVVGHVAAVTLALRTRVGAMLLQPFVATGRMPLTTYLGANVVAGAIFAGWGLGLWNTLGYAGFEGVALGIIAVQLAGANLWLRAFASGPFEWLWKSLAYQRAQPWRRAVGGGEVTA